MRVINTLRYSVVAAVSLEFHVGRVIFAMRHRNYKRRRKQEEREGKKIAWRRVGGRAEREDDDTIFL